MMITFLTNGITTCIIQHLWLPVPTFLTCYFSICQDQGRKKNLLSNKALKPEKSVSNYKQKRKQRFFLVIPPSGPRHIALLATAAVTAAEALTRRVAAQRDATPAAATAAGRNSCKSFPVHGGNLRGVEYSIELEVISATLFHFS